MKSEVYEFDAIVVGSGISGGWAAKELTEQGLKTLVLERGRMVEHIKDYTTTNMSPWEFRHRSYDTSKIKDEYPIQSTNYAFNEATMRYFVNDKENPYSTPDDQPFRWIRGYQVGGKSLIWARQVYRWSKLDFEANAKDGYGVDWPIRYEDIAPWYDYVEEFAGISGQSEGNQMIPDGQFQAPMEMTCVEKHVRNELQKHWKDRLLTIGRVAHLMEPKKNRSKCQFRDLCYRGCPYGAYFSSNSSTLPAAMETGNLTLRPNSIVESILYDDKKGKATGVRVLDAETGETNEYKARILFLCASTLGTTWIMLNSRSSRFPNGFANDSGVLGHYLMDHHAEVVSAASYEAFNNKTSYGGRPNGIYIPRFQNVKETHSDFIRGYGMQGNSYQTNWSSGLEKPGFGAEFKKSLTSNGTWIMLLEAFGECLPYYDNKVELDTEKVDKWGLPTLRISAEFKENEQSMRKDMALSTAEILEATGGKNIKTNIYEDIPGFAVHEMGTARMGRDPETSILNGYNQCHSVSNVFITDGSCMVSSACQNPSITYMALTARACAYAVNEMKKHNL